MLCFSFNIMGMVLTNKELAAFDLNIQSPHERDFVMDKLQFLIYSSSLSRCSIYTRGDNAIYNLSANILN